MPNVEVLVAALAVGAWVSDRQHIWQSDLQIKSMTVSSSGGNLTARFQIIAELGEARAAKIDIMLPPGVGIVELGSGCRAGASAPGVGALRARVLCSLGDLPPRMLRELYVVTTRPPSPMPAEFGVVALSDTPDPHPGNNFAKRKVP